MKRATYHGVQGRTPVGSIPTTPTEGGGKQVNQQPYRQPTKEDLMKKKHLMSRKGAKKIGKMVLRPSRFARLVDSYLTLLDVVEEQKATIVALQQ